MSTITTDDVRHLAQLSNLQLSDDELAALQVDLENILNYVHRSVSSIRRMSNQPTKYRDLKMYGVMMLCVKMLLTARRCWRLLLSRPIIV